MWKEEVRGQTQQWRNQIRLSRYFYCQIKTLELNSCFKDVQFNALRMGNVFFLYQFVETLQSKAIKIAVSYFRGANAAAAGRPCWERVFTWTSVSGALRENRMKEEILL